MLTIKELESKASAAELCLIREVASALRKEVADEVTTKAVRFLRSNPPLSPYEAADPVKETQQYVERLVKAMTSTTES